MIMDAVVIAHGLTEIDVIAPYLPSQMSFLRVIPEAWRVPFTFPTQRNRLPLLNRRMNY